MKLLIKNKIEIIQNTRFEFFFSNTVSLVFQRLWLIDCFLFPFFWLALLLNQTCAFCKNHKTMQLHDYTLSIWIGDGFPCEPLQIGQETWIQHHWETSQQSWMLMMVFNHFLMKRCDSFVDSIRILRVRNWRKDWFQKPAKPFWFLTILCLVPSTLFVHHS